MFTNAAGGIEVVYTPDANTLAVGDFVFGYLLQLLRPWEFFRDTVYPPKEFKRIRDTVRGRQLNELTIGVLGMGRVGKRVGHIAANGFGMKVIYNDLVPVTGLDFPATAVDKPTLYREADILTIHVDMRPGNENLVGRQQIALLKPSAVLINTSRGEVLDARAGGSDQGKEDFRRRAGRIFSRTTGGGLPAAGLVECPADAASGGADDHGAGKHELGGARCNGGFGRREAEVSRATHKGNTTL